jgi:Transposase DDE domain
MYVDVSHIRHGGKTYTRYLLRQSYRQDGKVKHRTIANLSSCSAAEIEAIRLALRHKDNLSAVGIKPSEIVIKQGLSYGVVHVVHEVARALGIVAALGSTRDGALALWQVIARVIDQGSRLSAVRLARAHAVSEILGLGRFDEDDLYANLDWLAEHQPSIEKLLFEQQGPSEGLFLYDVTSTYLEGKHNAFGAFGYNRDGKRGKLQIVVGLLCNGAGRPLAIEVFPGNTQDTKTFAAQVDKVAQRFGGGEITFVGDRGMIRGPQIKALQEEGFHFITAITKPQIEALLTAGVLQMRLFDARLAEVTTSDGQRYILRRNPQRAEEIASSRASKYAALATAVVAANAYLATHPRANPATQRKNLQSRATKLRISGWTTFNLEGRTITLGTDPEALAEASKLDGCYVVKTDLPQSAASKDVVHDRYKDLALVEWAFRESKTVQLEMRPVNVRLETRTRGHAFVVMLAYSIIYTLATLWRDLDLTIQEGLDQLASLCLAEILLPNTPVSYQIPTPRDSVRQLLDAAHVRLPSKITPKPSRVATKAKLPARRNLRRTKR